MTIISAELRAALSSDTGPETPHAPRYVAIADAIEKAVQEGRLAPGEKLPPQRALAYDLGVTVGTVSRAYDLAARRGLVEGTVGRGTHVLAPQQPGSYGRGVGSASFLRIAPETPIPLKANLPAPIGQHAAVAQAAEDVLRQNALRMSLADYYSADQTGEDRALAADWLAAPGFTADPQHLVLCSGAQQALMTALMIATEPGDLVLGEALTYHVIHTQCRLAGRRLKPLPLDEEGIVPEALEEACRTQRPRALFLVPTLQNPTGAVMSEKRRAEIAAIAEAHALYLIEDGVYTRLTEPQRPLAAFTPERALLVSSLSKTVAPGLRYGMVLCPPRLAERARAAQHALAQGLPAITIAMGTHLLRSGEAARLAGLQQKECRARNALARETLGAYLTRPHPDSPHLWIELPEPWQREGHAYAFVEAARERGVALAADADFAIAAPPPSAHIRLALGAPESRALLEEGLARIKTLLEDGPLARRDLT